LTFFEITENDEAEIDAKFKYKIHLSKIFFLFGVILAALAAKFHKVLKEDK
jgi:hypothetical protein